LLTFDPQRNAVTFSTWWKEQSMSQIKILKRRTPLVATALMAIAVLLVTYASLKGRTTHNSERTYRELTTASAPQALPTKLEVELVTLQPDGFEPAEITRPQGRFVLGIDNRSGLEDIQLRLERADGSRVPILNGRKRRLSWREEVDLPTGQYVIRETNQREWNCLITITSR
jgi:hypothetical protein